MCVRSLTLLDSYTSELRVSQFPIAGSTYESEAGTSFSGVPLEIANLALATPDPSPDSRTIPPAGGGIFTIPASMKMRLDVDLGPGTADQLVKGFFDITYLIANDGSGGGGVGAGVPLTLR